MSVWHATNDAVDAARDAGQITAMDEGLVEVVLRMAERLDHPDFPVIDGRLDNVTEPTYLRACEALGLSPASRAKLGPRKGAGTGGKLAGIRSVEDQRKKRAGRAG